MESFWIFMERNHHIWSHWLHLISCHLCCPKNILYIYSTLRPHKGTNWLPQNPKQNSKNSSFKSNSNSTLQPTSTTFEDQTRFPWSPRNLFQPSHKPKTSRILITNSRFASLFSNFDLYNSCIINEFWSHIIVCMNVWNVSGLFDLSLSAGIAICHC